MTIQLPIVGLPHHRFWVPVQDGDGRARALYHRHYSRRRYRDGRDPKLFVGPGEKIVLLGHDARALFVWRKFKSDDGQHGVNCAVFRNESPHRSSDMIREAMQIAWNRWPGERFYTYVNPRKVTSPNPGYCFKCAGWQACGRSKRGLVILEAMPVEEMRIAA